MTVPTTVRVGDDDRTRTATLLGLALAQGYLDMADHDHRLKSAFGAQTSDGRHVLTVWLAVGLTAGAWYFWPIWPILGAGIGVLAHALPMRYVSGSVCGRVTARSVPPGWRIG